MHAAPRGRGARLGSHAPLQLEDADRALMSSSDGSASYLGLPGAMSSYERHVSYGVMPPIATSRAPDRPPAVELDHRLYRRHRHVDDARPRAPQPGQIGGCAQQSMQGRRRHPQGVHDRADRPPSRGFGRSWRATTRPRGGEPRIFLGEVRQSAYLAGDWRRRSRHEVGSFESAGAPKVRKTRGRRRTTQRS